MPARPHATRKIRATCCEQRIGLICSFHTIAHAIAVGIRKPRIGACEIFIAIVQAITIRVQRGIGGGIRVEAVGNFPDVRHPIFVGVARAGEGGKIHQIRGSKIELHALMDFHARDVGIAIVIRPASAAVIHAGCRDAVGE